MKKASPENQAKFDSITMIKGLLKAMQVAHSDNNKILFDRIKTVLTNIARGSKMASSEEHKVDSGSKSQNKDKKILMTEVMSLVLKPTKDSKMHQAYVDCFINLTKTLCDSADSSMIKFVCFTYKELLKKFLGGRGTSSHCLNMQFWTQIFE